jgi:hypothetical protein
MSFPSSADGHFPDLGDTISHDFGDSEMILLRTGEYLPGRAQRKLPELLQSLCFQGHDNLCNFFGIYLEILNWPLRTVLSGMA